MHTKWKTCYVLILILLASAVQPAVLMADAEIDTDVLDSGGGMAESASIRLHGCLGQAAIGPPALDTTIELRDGFLQTIGPPLPPPPYWAVELTVSDTGGAVTQYRTFGEHGWATDGFDPDFDQIIPPPGFTFYSWLQGELPFAYLSTSIKAHQYDSVYWTLSVLNAVGVDYTISWDQADFPPEGWQLHIDDQDMRLVDQIARSGNAELIIEAWHEGTSVDAQGLVALETDGGSVLLRCERSCPPGASSLNVYRSLSQPGPFDLISTYPITCSPFWQFEDSSVWPGTAFWYEVRAVMADGTEAAAPFGHAFIQTSGVRRVELLGARPNPFAHNSVVAFVVPSHEGKVRITVYDVSGRLVKTLVDESVGKGRHEVTWDGTDDSGQQVGAGVYLCRLEAGGQGDTAKIVRLK